MAETGGVRAPEIRCYRKYDPSVEPNTGASLANTTIIRLHLFSFLLFLPLAFKVEFVSFLNGDPILYRFFISSSKRLPDSSQSVSGRE